MEGLDRECLPNFGNSVFKVSNGGRLISLEITQEKVDTNSVWWIIKIIYLFLEEKANSIPISRYANVLAIFLLLIQTNRQYSKRNVQGIYWKQEGTTRLKYSRIG